tara:strand:- start:811 stop:2034 length:1224 start_codon:yes stop_codon:yes gene_type:complete
MSHKWFGGLQVPRNVNLLKHGVKKFFDVKSFPPAEAVAIKGEYRLRDYQQAAVDGIFTHGEGVIIAPCGAGKTSSGIGAMARLKTPALVLVHTLDLAEQWARRCEDWLGITPSMLGGGSKDRTGRVVIGTFQTIASWSWAERYDWAKQFGLMIADESHHVPATTFSDVMSTMTAKYRMFLTATPDRPDGLSQVLYWHAGDVLHEITTPELIKRGVVMAPEVRFHHSGWAPEGDRQQWSAMISTMCADEERTASLLDWVSTFVAEGRQVLVLSDRVAHCKAMAAELAADDIKAVAFTGSLSKKKRQELLRAADARELDVICATVVADEGLDLPGLDTVVLTCPVGKKSMGRIQQRIGRIMRVKEGKKVPLVFDVVDDTHEFRGLARKRYRLYLDLGCAINNEASAWDS